MNTTIATFYRFAEFADFEQWQQPLKTRMKELGVTGTILLAPEGVNATIAGKAPAVQDMITQLQGDDRFAALDVKYANENYQPFEKAKVKIKQAIITMGEDAPQAACLTGHQATVDEWDALIAAPDVVILDTRNEYETYLGTFKGAVLWPMRKFSQIIEKIEAELPKTQKIGMFCTGGVRCEKLSSWMLEKGYENIYQLEGGIIRYLEKRPDAAQSNWIGSCYVFDERIAVTHGNVTDHTISLCPSCDHPLKAENRNHAAYLPAIQCEFCV